MQKIAPRSQNQIEASISLDGIETNKPKDDWTGCKKRKRTAEEIAYQSKVAEMGCIVCQLRLDVQHGSTFIHHVRISAKRHNNHLNVLPLCFECHQGKEGVHGDKSRLHDTGKTEIELLEIVRDML